MITKRTIFEIHQLKGLGMSERATALRLGISRVTVKKYIEDPDISESQRARKPSKLDPYLDYIDELLDKWHEASAVVIKQRLEDKGYTGGISILRDYLHTKRGSKRKPRACIRFESPPGQQFQCDWGHFGSLTYGNTKRKLYCMAVIECHARMLYVEFTHSQNQQAFMRTLLNSFIFFHGAPKELVHDNLKTAVIERIGGIIRFNEEYLHFLRPFHITPYACGIGDAQAKGKIEKGGVHYVRYNFWPCRTFDDLDDVNAQATQWRDQIANLRVHETTREVPQKRFRPYALRPLPDSLPDTRDTTTAKVHTDCRFKFDANAYSAPHWIVGKTLTIKADNQTITAHHKNKIIARHKRSWCRKAVIENPNHVKDLLVARTKALHTKQQELFLSIGKEAETFLEGLARADKNLAHAIVALLDLRDQYGTQAVLEAIRAAMKYKAYGVDYVRNILYQNARSSIVYQRVNLKDPALNELRLQEPDLLVYDAITLKKRRENHDQA